MSELAKLGWSSFFEQQEIMESKGDGEPARVIAEHKNTYILSRGKEHAIPASLSGNFLYKAAAGEEYPVVGDWVLFRANDESQGLITGLFNRKSHLSRRQSLDRNSMKISTKSQLIASNLDLVFIVMSLNHDFSQARINRLLTMVWDSGATPVILLSKSDLCDERQAKLDEIKSIALGVDVHLVSSIDQTGIEVVLDYLKPGITACLIGSSGVGKSTLTNLLCDEHLKTLEIREDDSKGRHATTSRRLFVLSQGGMIIDTPGMREFGLAGEVEGLSATFSDIEALAVSCKFKDCTHQTEPGCAVLGAIKNNQLTNDRLEQYAKLKKEIEFFDSKNDPAKMREIKKQQKQLGKLIKDFSKQRKNR